MEKNDLISVIVPVYNVEAYLEKCIITIINQSYKNLEILLINDGSTDMSKKICENYEQQDNRIKLINKKNGGLSDARNVGIENANGKYYIFIDSDDFISENMIEKLYKCSVKNNSDITVCNYYIVENEKITKRVYLKNKEYTVYGQEKFDCLYNNFNKLSVVAWNKLYKSTLFEKIRYPFGKINEDEFIICDLLKLANKVTYISDALYYYVQRNNSIIHKFSIKRFNAVEAYENRIKFFEENQDFKNIQNTKLFLFCTLINLLSDYYIYLKSDGIFDDMYVYVDKLKKLAKELNHKEIQGFKNKLKLILANISPWFLIKLNAMR